MKRGQVTVFIIVGLIALIAVVLTLYVNSEYINSLFEERTARLAQLPQEIQPVEENIQSCIEQTSKTSLNLIFAQGGYFEPKNYIEMEAFNVAYWFYKKDTSPSIETIEKETANSMNYLLSECILDFQKDYEIEIIKIVPIIKIKDDKVISSIEAEIRVEYKNITYDLNKNYESSFNSEAKRVFNVAQAIIDSEKQNPGAMDLTLLANTPYKINFFRFNETIVYAISDQEPILMFANKF